MPVERVLLATPRSFCAGVEMAIKALAWMVRVYDPPVYCYHEIVHNRVVVERFRRAGVVFVDDVEDAPPDAPLMLSAHGSSPEVVWTARARSNVVVDAVCPLVKKVHHEVRQRSRSGQVVYAGHATHDEAVGTLAVAPELTHLVENPADVQALGKLDGPIAFLAQTTLALDDWQTILDATRDRFGDVWTPTRRDLCFATTNRQAAMEAMAPRCDVVVVIGSASSSNTLSLAQVAERTSTARVLRINDADELPDDLHGTVGVTAGASAPEDVVQEVLRRLAPSHGTEMVDVTNEDEYFPPPRELRELLRNAGSEGLLDDDRSIAASDVLRDLAGRDIAGRAVTAGSNGTSPRTFCDLESPPPRGGQVTERSAAELLGTYTGRIDHEIASVLADELAAQWLRDAIAYHLGWLDDDFQPLPSGTPRAGGKKLRGTLAILSYEAAAAAHSRSRPRFPGDDRENGGENDLVGLFAAAVELLHNWSLVHDDIEDGDRTRRGRPALWTLCGEAQAINVGDCIYALAFRCLSRLADRGLPASLVGRLTAALARTAVDLTVGQMRDLTLETTLDIDRDRYLEMIEGKTAALLRYTTWGGALLGSGDRHSADTFAEYGHRLGLAFQIRDDILGIWGTTKTGKPTDGDIRRRKKTLPIVLALDGAEPRDHDRLSQLYRQDTPSTANEVAEVRQILARFGAQPRAQRWAEQQRAAALAALERVATTHPRAAAHLTPLETLTDFVTSRNH